jgi:3-phosphoinositide dependent protein kinase-1
MTDEQDLDTASRPTAADIKAHPFFSSIDFATIWTTPAPPMSTGISKPVITLANIDPQSDMWAVFDDDVSDGGFGDDADLENAGMPHDASSVPPHAQAREQSQGHGHVRQVSSEDLHRWSPQYDHLAAADAVRSVDLTDPSMHVDSVHGGSTGVGADAHEVADDPELDPPRPGWMDSVRNRKKRGFSRGSARTSSSSSANRTALTGLLESMGIHSIGQTGSGRTSRNSMKSEDTRPAVLAPSSAAGMGSGGGAMPGVSPQKGTKRGSRSGSASASAGNAGVGVEQERINLRLSHMQGIGHEGGPWYVISCSLLVELIEEGITTELISQVITSLVRRTNRFYLGSDDPHLRPALVPHTKRYEAAAIDPHRLPALVCRQGRELRHWHWKYEQPIQ